MKYIKTMVFIILTMMILHIHESYAINVIKTDTIHSTIPENYHFAPRFIKNKTTIELSEAPKNMKWKVIDGYYQLQNKSSKALMPSNEYKGKIYVIYHQVGYFNEQSVDMKITITDWSQACKRIEFGKNYIGFGNASGSSGGTSASMNAKIEYFYAGTNQLFQGLKGHQPVGDLDYFENSRQNEWIQLKTNCSSQIIIPYESYHYFNLTKLNNNMIGTLQGHGGTSNTDGLNFVYLFNSPSHTIGWYGGFLRMNMTCPDQEFQINYYGMLGSGHMKQQVVNYGVASKLRNNEFEKEGYHFNGWHVYRDYDDSWACLNGDYWQSGEFKCSQLNHYNNQVSVSKTAPCGNVYMYACFKPNEYTVTFDCNGGKGNMNQQKFIYDQSSPLHKNEYVKDGYDFIGWSTLQNGQVIYNDQEYVKNLTCEHNKNITLYAIWKKKGYVNHISHIINGYDHQQIGAHTSSFTGYYNDQFLLKDYSIKPPLGFQLDNQFYSGSIDELWLSYDVSKPINQKPYQMNFYLYYSPIQYHITYQLNGGTNHLDNPDSYNVLDQINLLEPHKEGCEFVGWFYNNKLITGINNSHQIIFDDYQSLNQQLNSCISGNIKLEARWKSIPDISTKTNYYYRNEEVSLKELLKNAKANDYIDGDLSSKIQINQIVYPTYTDTHPTKLDTSQLGIAYVTYSVENSSHYKSEKVGTLYIVDKDINTSSHQLKVYPRFISDELCSDGLDPLTTLNQDSIWLYSSYYEILKNSLTRFGNDYLHEYDYINERN